MNGVWKPSHSDTISRRGLTQRSDVTLVLEPTAHGAVKTARKGSGIFKVTATGVEAHAGLAPQDGASAITALSEFVLAAAAP
jgi:glutamate carboxypeptidase